MGQYHIPSFSKIHLFGLEYCRRWDHNWCDSVFVLLFHSLKHKNLVDMVGFSCDGPYPCLVYVFMGNGSLLDRLACLVSDWIWDTCLYTDISTGYFVSTQEGSPPLTWQQRCLIAEGTAEGLEYLHSNHHVHRDVKRYIATAIQIFYRAKD